MRAAGGRCAGYEDAAFCVSVTVTNSGSRAGEEAVLMYLSNGGRAVSHLCESPCTRLLCDA